MKPHFILLQTSVIDRYIESSPEGGLKNERISLQLDCIGSGNTSKIHNLMLESEIMGRLEFIGLGECSHEDIVFVTEKPQGEVDGEMQFQPEKKYVKCADCGMILPIRTITQEEKIVPLIELEDE